MATDNTINWETIANIATAIIALCALGLTLWQAALTRKHNRLSVKPHLATWTHINNESHHYRVDLLNNGIGPAVIKEFAIEVDGKRIEGETSDLIDLALDILFPKYRYRRISGYVDNGYVMSANEKRELVVLEFLTTPFPSPELIQEILRRVTLKIEYESIYGDKFTLDTQSESTKQLQSETH